MFRPEIPEKEAKGIRLEIEPWMLENGYLEITVPWGCKAEIDDLLRGNTKKFPNPRITIAIMTEEDDDIRFQHSLQMTFPYN